LKTTTMKDAATHRDRSRDEEVAALRIWVKLRRPRYEHVFSALPSNWDIARCSRHVSNVPQAGMLDHVRVLVCLMKRASADPIS
jgi:hypothetical protein